MDILQPYWIHSFDFHPIRTQFLSKSFDSFEGVSSLQTWFQFFLGVASATPLQPSGLSHTSPASISCTEPAREKKLTLISGMAIEGITKHHLIRPQFCGVSVERAFIVGFTQEGLDGEKNGPYLHYFQLGNVNVN